jgi:GH25 family lysozyme M1 (1,4-beta-N-acetylmuramidase)
VGPRQAKLTVALFAALATIALAAPAADAGPGRLGIDVSRFNGTIDWTSVRADGVRFAFVAASRGSGADCAVAPTSCGTDPNYDANYANARASGVRVGPYHRAFVDGANEAELLADARAEADVFIASVGTIGRKDLSPALDVETPFEVPGPNGLKKWLRAWVKRVHKRLGAKPLIYTNVTSWSSTGNTLEFARRGHHLWVANWGVSKPAVPASNWGGRGWTVWQYTSSGSIDGISGRVDLNRHRGSFRKIAAG